MPKGTETLIIEGGNHRGFGSYTHQVMDWEVSKCLIVVFRRRWHFSDPSFRPAIYRPLALLAKEFAPGAADCLAFSTTSCIALAPQATITPDEQRRIIVEALTEFIERRVVA